MRNSVQRHSAAFAGVFELRADTDPGAPGPLAAPDGCSGPVAYRAAIRRRFGSDLAARQQLAVMARRPRGLPVSGPYAAEVRAFLTAIANPEKSR